MNICTKLFIIFIIAFAEVKSISSELFDLTPEDKEYLMSQLPRDHKLTRGMQQIFKGSHIKYADDRAKRQFMLYQSPPAPQPAYQLNIPIIPQTNPPSYVLVPNAPVSVIPQKQFPDYQQYQQWVPSVELEPSSTSSFNLRDIINHAAYESLHTKKPYPTDLLDVFTLKENVDSANFMDYPAPVQMVTDAPTIMNPPPLTYPASMAVADQSQHHIQNRVRTINNAAAALSNDVSSLMNDEKIILSAYNKAECDASKPKSPGPVTIPYPIPTPTSALTLPTPPAFVIQTRPSTQAPKNAPPPATRPPLTEASIVPSQPSSSIAASPSSSSTPPCPPSCVNQANQVDPQLKAKLIRILENVESIKTKTASSKEGLPCTIVGKWVSYLAGSGFTIEKTASLKFPVLTFPTDCEGFMKNGTWQVNARTPLPDGGLFVVTAIHSSDFTMATFTGECRTCNNEDTVIGHWLVMKPALTCDEMNRGQDFFGDTWKRSKNVTNVQSSTTMN